MPNPRHGDFRVLALNPCTIVVLDVAVKNRAAFQTMSSLEPCWTCLVELVMIRIVVLFSQEVRHAPLGVIAIEFCSPRQPACRY
jgi:hypothetical protein